MTFVLTIPMWSLYGLGALIGLFVMALAIVGALALIMADKLPGRGWFKK